MLYAPLAKGLRQQATTFVIGIVKPTAVAIAALPIIVLAGLVDARAISYFALTLLCVWLLVVARRQASVEQLRICSGKTWMNRFHGYDSIPRLEFFVGFILAARTRARIEESDER